MERFKTQRCLAPAASLEWHSFFGQGATAVPDWAGVAPILAPRRRHRIRILRRRMGMLERPVYDTRALESPPLQLILAELALDYGEI